ncbi:PepSY domain-containing protein [uncultured Cohaesibacter sp.]|uniref:PepSY domain-containing protein n=1 Tax=uncultured Cohaesibacter sp. TaxID=1002546 RepID=UPI0029C8DADA|nr:PepSY domain-containing protein [uncultured Cohaesibacter sp.]
MAYAAEGGASQPNQEATIFQSAKITFDDAVGIAKKELAGALSEVGFDVDHGVGLYTVKGVGADGKLAFVKIDANSGNILAKGVSPFFSGDEDHHEKKDGHWENEHDDERDQFDGEHRAHHRDDERNKD